MYLMSLICLVSIVGSKDTKYRGRSALLLGPAVILLTLIGIGPKFLISFGMSSSSNRGRSLRTNFLILYPGVAYVWYDIFHFVSRLVSDSKSFFVFGKMVIAEFVKLSVVPTCTGKKSSSCDRNCDTLNRGPGSYT